MRTIVLGPPPPELKALIDRRRAFGLDLYDEVWEGEYHVAPAPHPSHGYLDDELAVLLRPLARSAGLTGTGPFNLGEPDDYRVPDRGLHRVLPATTFASSAAMVVEIVSRSRPGSLRRPARQFTAAGDCRRDRRPDRLAAGVVMRLQPA